MEQESAQGGENNTFTDPFQPEMLEGKSDDPVTANETITKEGYISGHYIVHEGKPLEQFSTQFSRAFSVASSQETAKGNGLYALVFEKSFPVDRELIKFLKRLETEHFTNIVDAGKLKLARDEFFALIIKQPGGMPISQLMKSGLKFNEKKLRENIIKPLNNILGEFHESGYCFGNINTDNIYYDQNSGIVTLKEGVSEFCGFSQLPAYETVNRIVCLPEAKGGRSPSADYYALGALAFSLLSGEGLVEKMEEKEVIKLKLTEGSYSTFENRASTVIKAQHSQKLMRGLLTDNDKDRWGEDEVADWCGGKDKAAVPPSRIHRETTTAFTFGGKEYLGRKHLVYDLQRDWNKAKSNLKLEEVSRWIKLALKLPKLSDFLDGLEGVSPDIALSDEKLCRILHLLDPDGPIRFKSYAINIWGMGSFLAKAFIEQDRDALQALGGIFSRGLVENWINVQDKPDDYSFSTLLWTPFKVAQNMHKSSSGFGMERCLYMLNPGMACQSKIISGHYVDDLKDMLLTLDEKSKESSGKTDPLDRHGAAFIANKIDLSEEIRVKSIQNHPAFARNPRILMTALLAVAQGETRIRTLKGLSHWMKDYISVLSEEFYNNRIRRDFLNALEKTAKSGSINELFKVVSNPSYVRRDQVGFIEAKRQYRALNQQMSQLGHQSNIERVAYSYGLRISVMFAYFVLVATLVLVVFRSA